MNALKRIPVHYKGELNDVRLINFSVDMDEVADMIPPDIKVRNFNGRALISMVDVKLRNMRPAVLPFVKFDYRHVAFRLLVDDSQYHDGGSKGIFFLRSFTDNPLIAFGGGILTDYNLETARIEENGDNVSIVKGDQRVSYCLNAGVVSNHELTSTIGALDRAYSVLGKAVRVTRIQRERWPIKSVECTAFENTFFKTARFEAAFRVFDTIYYDWLPPKTIGK